MGVEAPPVMTRAWLRRRRGPVARSKIELRLRPCGRDDLIDVGAMDAEHVRDHLHARRGLVACRTLYHAGLAPSPSDGWRLGVRFAWRMRAPCVCRFVYHLDTPMRSIATFD